MLVARSGEELLKICEKEKISLSEYAIRFEMEDRNPLSVRESPKFSKYFDSIWKELDVNA